MGIPTAEIAIAFDRVELNGAGTRLAVRPDRPAPRALSAPNGFKSRAPDLNLPPPDTVAKAAWFSFPAKGDFVLKRGFKSEWITIRP